MADNLDLLLRVRGDASSAKSAVEQTRQAIASLKERIREVGKETDIGFRTERIQALNTRLSELNQRHKEAKDATKQNADASKDLEAALGTLSPRLAGLIGSAGPITLVAAGFVASAAAAAALGTQLFGLAKASADFQGKIFDLKQQTGVAVETLSALEIVAATTGGSIDSIAQSLVVFQGKLDEAQDSTSKTGQRFKELGIETGTTETALRSALEVLAKMPAGFEQTNAAAELFGRRGGKQMLAILKETQGDLDGAIRRFRELGILISDADAKAADEFNDQLALLNFQLRAVGATIGKEIVPVALAAIKDLSQALKDNKDAIGAVATAAGALSNLFTGPLKGAIILIEDQWNKIRPVLETTAELYERIARAVNAIRGKTDFGGAGAGAVGAGLGDLPEVGIDASVKLPGLKTTDVQAGVKASADQLARDLEQHRKHTEDLRFEHERRTLELQEFFRKQDLLIDERYAALSNQITRERNLNQEAFKRGIADLNEYEDKKRDLDLQATKAENERDEARRRLRLERQRAATEEEIRNRTRLAELEDSRREGELQRLETALERGGVKEAEVLTRRLAFLKEAHKERIGIIDFELKAEGTSAERKEELNHQKALSEQRYTDEFKRLTRERVIALSAEQAADGPRFSQEELKELENQKIIVPDIENFLGTAPEGFAELSTQVIAGLDAMRDAFGALGQAVGQAVHAFVLFGSAGTSLRKFTAEVLAAVAAQAAVKAVFELAEGFAMLALTYFTGNPKYAASAGAHFVAAATYGAIAGVAAIAGRAVAGNEFNKGSGGSGGDRDREGTGQLNPLTLNRNQPQVIKHEHVLRIETNDSHIVGVVGKNFREGGEIRELVFNDGG